MQFSEWLQLISAVTALVAVIVGPWISFIIAKRQIRADILTATKRDQIAILRTLLVEHLKFAQYVGHLSEIQETVPKKKVEEFADSFYQYLLLLSDDNPAKDQLIRTLQDMVLQKDRKNRDHLGQLISLSKKVLQFEIRQLESQLK